MKIPLLLTCVALATVLFQSCSTNVATNVPHASSSSPKDYQQLLKKYVSSDGVRYDEWQKNSEDLSKLKIVTDYYAQNAAPKSEKTALAWYLNAYNAWILQSVFDHWPNDGPLDASVLFFHKKSIKVSGNQISFSHLENKIIREEFDESRIHFALNCASRSCPPLHDKPFKASTLDSTLEKLTSNFINKNSYAIVEQDDEVQISKIFEWYKADFGGDKELLNYINKYRKNKISSEKRIKFLPYNWELNRAN